MRKRLSVLIPLILLLVSAASALLIFLQESRENARNIEQLALREIGMDMSRLQSLLRNRLSARDETEAAQDIALVAMRPGVRALLLADGDNKVILANNFAWNGEQAAAHTAYSNAEAFVTLQGNTGKLQYSRKTPALLQGYFPLTDGYGDTDGKAGVLYVEFDISEKLAEAKETTIEQSLMFGSIMLAAALLIAYILHRLVSRRVKVLVDAAARVSTGDYSARTGLRGNDELALLGRAFDEMAQSVGQGIELRKEGQAELHREQERLVEAQKVGHFGSWELDLVSGTLVWSQEIFNIFEIDSGQFGASYEAFLNAIHPEDRDKVNRAYTDSLTDRKPYQITHRLQMPDGRIKWVEERCSSTFAADGKPLRSIGTVQDVTEREMLAEQARIAAVAFETQEAIIVTDAQANIIKVNHAFEVITGYSQEEVLGKNPNMLSSGRHEKVFYQHMWDEINNHGRWSGEMWDRRKDGGIYPKWLTITSVKFMGEVTHYVAVFVDITERKKAEEEIKNLAFYDPLTQLPNRRLMQDRLRLAVAQSARSEGFGALMFIDLDHFKVLNDTKGHEYGDRMLVEVAKRLQGCVRETDTTARFGGDEFVVLLEGLSATQAEAVAQAGSIAEKIRDALAQPYELGNTLHRSSPSIGVVLFKGDAVSTDELLKQADLAMYQAKEGGRNMVRFFETSMQAMLESRTLLENALRQAMPNNELELFYQLQTNDAKELLGAEVLLRWRSAVIGMVSPADFIPLAEQTKLILPIGHWVLETACKQLKAWEGHPLLGKMHLAVNISPVQFHQPDFVRQVKTILAETGANPRMLELELTENLVLEDVDEATRKMDALKEIGVRFSMDDFGTGYSSLQYIKRLPIDLLKIDQSFVRDILTDPGDAMMVQTIAGMAHNFGFNVIAEGVETHDQLQPLIDRGCQTFQGYLFSRPVPVADFEKLVEQWKSV
ncbi:MAG TPA: EAL domain-containing protein [Sideroxyarcus sp.]|nr:EAL domain-containing protein [Sideroxyarcus sp.]